ncbi:N-acetyltransferase GCN5 [Listeria floridensis FSL S10-1187]|uniref:N-acetyltransferase GCN5 n=1 Tax=Listeria floridensis FSL S10-1187 TaxID=1265817 RepID=A0ABN0RDW2_9LIST|nr:GNAT family N-acetyltransferase [Listeria floridensis]EUJ30331.1 N-acetyltransferase GCN5 [Listeria floridensis FSL S10-1187]
MLTIKSVRETPELAETAISYFQKQWATEESKAVYRDSILSSLNSDAPLPEWYLLVDGSEVLGCAGLITNDFISRMDLWPWLCALYIEKDARGNGYGELLIERAKRDARERGYAHLYLCTDLAGYYEKYAFRLIGTGYHPWGEASQFTVQTFRMGTWQTEC